MSQTNENWKDNMVLGSLKAIKLDERGKKQTIGDMAGWSKLTESKVIDGHLVKFVLTGEKSGVIVVDFDNRREYHDLTNIYHNENVLNREPIFDKTLYPTVETKNGYHIYFEYNDELLQPDKNLLNVDIQGNGKRVYAAGSKYKINETDWFEYKWINEDAPLQPVPERLLNYINDLSKKKNVVVKSVPVAVADTISDPEAIVKIKEYIELISNNFKNDRESWLRLVFAMKRCDIEEAYVREWSRTDDFVMTTEEWEKAWKSEDNREDGCGVGTIYHYAKASNELEYVRLKRKYKEYAFNLDCISESSLAALYDKLEGTNLVYCETDKEFYVWYNGKWRAECRDGMIIRRLISNALKNHFNERLINLVNSSLVDDDIKTQKTQLTDVLKTVERTGWLDKIWKELQSISKFKDIKVEFDCNPDIIGFTNKMKYNFVEKKWSAIEYSDYITMYAGCDYIEPTDEEYNRIDTLMNEIFPNEEIRRSYLSIMYSSCIGGKKDKFVIANGGGANGKGLLNELLKMLLGDYAYEAPVAIFTKEFKTGANPELANFHNKRLALVKEPDGTDKLMLGNIKSLCDNDSINARQLYKGDCVVKLCATLIMECNKRLKFTTKASNAETRRYMDILFQSTFTDDPKLLNNEYVDYIYPMNTHYKSREFQKAHLCGLFKYIIDNADATIYNPLCVRERTNEYIENEDNFRNWWLDEVSYEITHNPEDIVKVKSMFEYFKTSDYYNNLPKGDRPLLKNFRDMVCADKDLRIIYKDIIRPLNPHTGKYDKISSVLVGLKLAAPDCSDDDD